MYYKKEIVLFFFVFVLLQIASADVKEFELISGHRVALEPSSKIDFVIIHIMLDKTKCLSKIEDLVYSELVLHSIKNGLKDLTGITRIHSLQYRPEHPYNWRKNRFLTHKIKKENFTQKIGEVATLLNRKIRISNRTITDLLFERNNILADSSSQYTAEELIAIKEIFIRLGSITRLDVQNFFSGKDITNCVKIHIFGDFNPLDIIPKLELRKSTNPNLVQYAPIKGSLTFSSIELETLDGSLNLKIPIGPVNPESIIASEFLIDYLDSYISNNFKKAKVRYYNPWSLKSTILTAVIENPIQHNIDSDSLLLHLSKLNNLKKKTIINWYYSKYINKIEWIINNIDDYLIYKQLSKLYFDDYEVMFRVLFRDSLAFSKIHSILREVSN